MVDVYVPGDAPAHHLEVVDADTLLQQVVPLLIVDQQNVLADNNKLMVGHLNIPACSPARYLTEQPVQPLHGHPGVGSQRVEHVADVLPIEVSTKFRKFSQYSKKAYRLTSIIQGCILFWKISDRRSLIKNFVWKV